jgi:hypothetical protein
MYAFFTPPPYRKLAYRLYRSSASFRKRILTAAEHNIYDMKKTLLLFSFLLIINVCSAQAYTANDVVAYTFPILSERFHYYDHYKEVTFLLICRPFAISNTWGHQRKKGM